MDEPTSTPQTVNTDQISTESEIPQESNKKKSKLLLIVLISVFLILLIAGGVFLFILSRKDGGVVKSIKSLFGIEDETREEVNNSQEVSEADETDDDSDVGEEIIYEYSDCSDMWMADGWNSYTNGYWSYSLKHTKDIFVEEFDDTFPVDRTEFTVGNEPLIFLIFQTFIKQTDNIDSQLGLLLTNTCTEDIEYTNVQYGDNTYRKATATENETCLAARGVEREKELAAFAHELEDGIYFILRNDNYNLEQETEVMCSVTFE